MQNPKKLGILLLLATLCAFTLSIALATDGEGGLIIGGDDGMMFRRNVSKTPDSETADAYIGMMEFYVPAQSSDGIVGPVEYYGGDGALIETRDYAKPLFTSYIDGVEVDGQHSPVVRVVEGALLSERVMRLSPCHSTTERVGNAPICQMRHICLRSRWQMALSILVTRTVVSWPLQVIES